MNDANNSNPSAKNAADAIAHIRAGGKALLVTYTKATQIDRKCLERWERAGLTLLKDARDEGAILMASGRRFVHLLPGQLKLV